VCLRVQPSPLHAARRSAHALADVGNAADTAKVTEPFALFRILGDKYDLVNDLLKGVNEPAQLKVRPSYTKKYFSFPLARRASPPTRITADRLIPLTCSSPSPIHRWNPDCY